MIEEWRALAEYDNKYEVSNLGRVRSLDRYVLGSRGGKQFKAGVILTPKIRPNGYQVVHIRYNGHNGYPLVHRLVASAFLANEFDLPQVNHKDGNKLNNRVDNLEWCTPSENIQHALLHKLMPSGENSNFAKLSYDEVLRIKSEYKRGTADSGIVALAKKYGISKSMVSLIVRNEKWKYADLITED